MLLRRSWEKFKNNQFFTLRVKNPFNFFKKFVHVYKVNNSRADSKVFCQDLEMKTREQNRNDKQTEIERFDWSIERADKRA